MNTVSKKNLIFDFIVCGITVVLILGQLIKLGNFPGLYLDAINPDYTAVQILFPHEHQIKWMVSWPWLTQLYHGNITVIFTLISIIITGSTSVLQHHIVYGILAVICVLLLYRLLTIEEIGISRYIAAMVAFAIATTPSLIGIIITQYYIEIFGTACILLGMIFYYQWKFSEHRNIQLILCYLMFGLAFYSYFNFLFFMPPLVIGTALSCHRTGKMPVYTILQGAISYLAGCSFYFIGYTQIFLSSICNTTILKNIMLLLFTLILYTTLFTLLWLSANRNNYFKIAVCIAGGAGVLWTFSVLPAISSYAESLNISGQAANFLQKILFSLRWLFLLVTGKSAEIVIYENPVTTGNDFIWIAEIILTMVLLLIEIIRKKIFLYSVWKEIIGWIFCYFICTIALASRMQPQHFVPLLFFLMLLFALEINAMNKMISPRKIRWKKPLTILLALLVIGNNLINETRIIQHIQETGGIGMYSSQINELASEVLNNANAGIKEIYVFCEWGFMCGFNYLTQNRVEVTTELNAEYLSRYVESGYHIVICFWDKSNETMYEEFLKNWGEITKSVRYQGNHDIAFYTISLGTLTD